jgi:hypothetical protein
MHTQTVGVFMDYNTCFERTVADGVGVGPDVHAHARVLALKLRLASPRRRNKDIAL